MIFFIMLDAYWIEEQVQGSNLHLGLGFWGFNLGGIYDADSNVKKALIPNIKIEFLRKNLEIVTIEQAKSEDVKKKKNDTSKLCTCLHDMIRQIYNIPMKALFEILKYLV
jgi:hypothetical protein